ncbi:MAG: hypothetical protein HY272_07870 [Gammaproteobacteria bacterium]|nr:hypothetical protein [Gammaproteobacteria bacterium]
METSLIVAIGSYFVMLFAYYMKQWRFVHMPLMAAVIMLDMMFPIYLILNRDWYKRLIEQEEIFSFMIWMHLILIITLYALYVLQISTARKMLQGDMTAKNGHRSQGIGILVVRGLVVLSAALLIEPDKHG